MNGLNTIGRATKEDFLNLVDRCEKSDLGESCKCDGTGWIYQCGGHEGREAVRYSNGIGKMGVVRKCPEHGAFNQRSGREIQVQDFPPAAREMASRLPPGGCYLHGPTGHYKTTLVQRWANLVPVGECKIFPSETSFLEEAVVSAKEVFERIKPFAWIVLDDFFQTCNYPNLGGHTHYTNMKVAAMRDFLNRLYDTQSQRTLIITSNNHYAGFWTGEAHEPIRRRIKTMCPYEIKM